MKKAVLIILLIFIQSVFALETIKPHSLISKGQQYTLNSKVLNMSIDLQLHSDAEEKESGGSPRPLFIVLDSQKYYNQAVAAYEILLRLELVPKMNIVGVHVTPRMRSELYYQSAGDFLLFLKREIVHFVEKHKSESSLQIIFGWEMAGGFLVDTLAHEPESFSAYLAASPSPIYGSYFPSELKAFSAFKEKLKSGDMNNVFFLFTEAKHDFPVQYGMKNILELMQEHAPDAMWWEYKKWQEETHQSTPYKTIFHGLKTYFQGHSYLQIDDIGLNGFEGLGGLTYFENYHQKRNKKYGFNAEEKHKAKYKSITNLLIQALSEDDFVSFDNFMKRFFTDINDLQHLHPNQANNFSLYYLKNDRPQQALKMLDFLISKSPNSAKPMNNKGDVLFYMHKHNQAFKAYKKAVDLAVKNNDWRLSEYQADLEKSQVVLKQ